jgi:hypothetical protein
MPRVTRSLMPPKPGDDIDKPKLLRIATTTMHDVRRVGRRRRIVIQ